MMVAMTTDPRLLDDLAQRGLVQDTTDYGAMARRLDDGPIGVYCGFDPTAPSLHVGNLIGLLTLARFQRAGHRPLPLAGGATGMIGDPSGKSAERSLLDDDSLAENLAQIVPTLRQFVDFEADENPAKLLDNRAWTVSMSILDFLRDVGKHVTVNNMVAKESVRNRMEGDEGISFTEFSYMLLQAHDFLWLFEHEGVEMQVGGSDQWGNISLGVDLIRRRVGAKAHALTWPLLVRKDGSKYGKTAGGETLWLNPDMMSPYRFYQAWIQTEDDEIRHLLLKLTFLAIDEVDAVVAEHAEAPHLRVGQRRLAHEVTALVHGVEAASGAIEASKVLFGGGDVASLAESTFAVLADEVETVTVGRERLDDPDNLVPLLVDAGVASSKSEAGRLLNQHGIAINDTKVTADDHIGRTQLRHDRYCLIRKGKKSVFLLEFA
jgi:tyrosyl-tRNA synthetase